MTITQETTIALLNCGMKRPKHANFDLVEGLSTRHKSGFFLNSTLASSSPVISGRGDNNLGVALREPIHGPIGDLKYRRGCNNAVNRQRPPCRAS
jgi:hypothetical protein